MKLRTHVWSLVVGSRIHACHHLFQRAVEHLLSEGCKHGSKREPKFEAAGKTFLGIGGEGLSKKRLKPRGQASHIWLPWSLCTMQSAIGAPIAGRVRIFASEDVKQSDRERI